ncbi:SGNH/GDSL hydrolase family protein [Candidatus Omnitrophota bacterium]
MIKKTIKIVLLNIAVFLLLFCIVESLSSAMLIYWDHVNERRHPQHKDPYTGKLVRAEKIGNRYLGERYAPYSLAQIYYKNDKSESPQGLYTDQYGFVHNGDPYRDLREKLESGRRVFLFGGSSVVGANSTTSNTRTIASFLERSLRKKHDARDQVVNAAVEGYESFRDFILAAHLVGQFDMDILIFLNGRNDWYRLTATDSFYHNYYPETEALYARLSGLPVNASRGFIESLSVVKFMKKLKSSKRFKKGNVHPVLSTAYKQKRIPRDINTINPEELFRSSPDGWSYRKNLTHRPQAVKNYIDNLRSIAGLCSAHKKRCIIALQPTLGYGDRELHEDEEEYLETLPFENWIQTQNEFYDQARDEFKKLSEEYKGTSIEFIDLTSLFDDSKERIFLDSIHYLDNGNSILGTALASQIIHNDWKRYRNCCTESLVESVQEQ